VAAQTPLEKETPGPWFSHCHICPPRGHDRSVKQLLEIRFAPWAATQHKAVAPEKFLLQAKKVLDGGCAGLVRSNVQENVQFSIAAGPILLHFAFSGANRPATLPLSNAGPVCLDSPEVIW
jgi:hypothetical protein